ncbi:MAG: type II toxin-antitoxin system RelE/ParE family toxin [Phycisphaeraceae bacterium]
MKRIIIHPAAESELEEAVAYYQGRGAGLGLEFHAEIEAAIQLIRQQPDVGAPYGRRGHRKYVLRRFPYLVFYLDLGQALGVVAVAHQKRRSGYWLSRRIG